MRRSSRAHIRHAGLFTFAHSIKHLHLYQKFGFWPRSLTPLLVKPVAGTAGASPATCFSELSAPDQGAALRACGALTSSIYEGLDLSREIQAVQTQQLGETLLVYAGSQLASFAVCHCGAGSEAGTGVCFVKFGAARPGPNAAEDFAGLLAACEGFAAARGAGAVLGGMQTARHQAYQAMLAHGFHFGPLVGVSMHRPDAPGYNRPDVYVIDDWR